MNERTRYNDKSHMDGKRMNVQLHFGQRDFMGFHGISWDFMGFHGKKFPL